MADSKRVTLATIAAETGVSVTTISKVLNGRGDVAGSGAGLNRGGGQPHQDETGLGQAGLEPRSAATTT